MQGEYPIILEDKVIGTAHVSRQGLYHIIECQCRFPGEGIHRVSLTCGGRCTDLGICIPRGGYSGLRTRLSVKQTGEGDPVFRIIAGKERGKEIFRPVDPAKPVDYLTELRGARWDIRDGVPGIVLTEQGQQGSDQSP